MSNTIIPLWATRVNDTDVPKMRCMGTKGLEATVAPTVAVQAVSAVEAEPRYDSRAQKQRSVESNYDLKYGPNTHDALTRPLEGGIDLYA